MKYLCRKGIGILKTALGYKVKRKPSIPLLSFLPSIKPTMTLLKLILTVTLLCSFLDGSSQNHPEIYINAAQKSDFQNRVKTSKRVAEFVAQRQKKLLPFVERHQKDPEWIVSRLQMYWNTKYERVYVNGMDFSHGEGKAPVPTVKFSGSRDWATDYLKPALEDIKPYLDDERGMYLQNAKKEGQPWEWVHPSKTGHIIEGINREILELAEEASFLYWLTDNEQYARFAADIVMKYTQGMYHRAAPITVGDHRNALLMGLQTFEVIHEGIIEPLTVAYDFLYPYLTKTNKDVKMVQAVFRKWADQEIKYGVPDNNWNMMQARFVTYLAIALEDDAVYEDKKGQQYYIDEVLNQNSVRQKSLKDVLKNYDSQTAIWPEVAGYSMMVSDDLLEIYCLMDRTLNNHLLADSPVLENAILANFHYLFPNDFTVGYGDAKHARLRFNSFELLAAQYHKYNELAKETAITQQLKRYIKNGIYNRAETKSLFELFFYLDDLLDTPPASSISDMVTPTFYSPNVSWIVQRNGHTLADGMMISKNASLGNHSHTNGINLELYAKGMVVAPDAAAGVSYWTKDHIEYYSRFPAHNTVVVDGKSDYRNMRGTQAFEVNKIYPTPNNRSSQSSHYTFSDVSFLEPSTDATQRRLTGSVRTSPTSGYFVDIFRSSKKTGNDKKHEYIFHGQGEQVLLKDTHHKMIATQPTDELSSADGDLVGYDYFSDKKQAAHTGDFVAQFEMPSITGKEIQVNVWMKGFEARSLFTTKAPYSRALHKDATPEALYHKPLPTLVVQQKGEAKHRPFVAIIDVFNKDESVRVEEVSYFTPTQKNPDFVGVAVQTGSKHIDYIYNDAEGKNTHLFNDGSFRGTYGIVSFENKTLQSLFLSQGTVLEKGGWKITSEEGSTTTVLVTANDTDLFIDADQGFKLTMPVSESNFTALEGPQQQQFKGSLIKKGEMTFMAFSLPAMKHSRLNKKK